MPDEGLGSWPRRRARMAPHDVAIIHDEDELTYRHLSDRVDALAVALAVKGVGRGDRVAYLGPNHPAFIETLFATCALGAVFVPVNTRLARPEVETILDDADPVLLVVSAGLTRSVPDSFPAQHTIVVGGSRGATAYDEFLELHRGGRDERDIGLDDVAMLMYTSGTTGRPKGVVLTHGNLIWNCFNVLIDVDLSRSEVTLVNAPLFHTAALNQTFLPTFVKGGTNVLMGQFDPDETLELIEQHEVTWMFGVPAMFAALTQAAGWGDADLSTVRAVEAGGAPVPESLIRDYQRRGVVFMQGYGMTEASPGVLFLGAKDSIRKVGSAGTPCFFTDVRLVTPEGRVATPGEPGELLVRGPNVMAGYWQLPEESDQVLDADGWLRSGDLATVDDDGYFTIVDRVKDMFISGGENVYPAEVENVLHENPAVLDCAVIGVPDERWGEVGRALVVLREGHELTVDELTTFLDGRIARYKVPKQIEFRRDLPRSASGKLLKHRITEASVGPGERAADARADGRT